MSGTAAPRPAPTGMPYYSALHGGAMLVFGCERTPLGVVVGAGAGPLYAAFYALMNGAWGMLALCLSTGCAVLFGGIYALRRMARRDPMTVRLYLRNRRYRAFYPARSTPACPS